MKKASKVLIGVLSVGALIGTGFAAWTINKGYTKAEAPGFTPDVIVNNNSSFGKFIVTQVEEKNEAGETVSPIKFDAPREVYNNGQKLPFDPGEEDLEVTYNLRAESDNGHPVDPYTLGAVNRHAYDGIATEYIPDVSISTKVVDAQKQEVSAEVLAEIKEYVALPEDVSERQMQIPYEKWLAADKKETGYDHTLRFGWGSLTHGENPQLYFIKEENKVEGKDLSESFEAYINKLNEVVKTSGIQFVFTFEIGGVEIFEANTSLISIVEGLGADLYVTHEGKEVKNGDELEIGAVVNVSASALEGYENPVITFNGKVIEAGEVTIVKGANEFGVTATKVTEPVDEKNYVHVGEARYELTLDDKGQYTAALPSVKAGDIVNVAHGDQLAPLGTFKPDTHETNNLVLGEDGKTMLVRQSAENVNIYFKEDMTAWLGGYVAPVDPTEKVFSGTLNGQSIDLEDVKAADSNDKAVYKLTLAIGDKVSFKYGDDVLGFYHWDNETNKAVKDGEEFIATKAGEHTFYINSDNQIYVGEPTGPVEPVENPKYYLAGNFNNWEVASEDYILNEVEGVYHFELTIAANATAAFKVVGPNSTWYGEDTTAAGSQNFEWVNNENHEVKIDIAFYPEMNADGKYIVASLVQGETPVDPVLSVEYYLTGKINGVEKWYGNEGVALTDLVKMDAPQDEKNLAEKLEISLKEGDKIKGIIVNKEDDAVKSVIWRGVDPSEQNVDGSDYVVPKDGKYNFYLTSTALYVTEVEETPVEEPKGSLANPYNVAEASEECLKLQVSDFNNRYYSEEVVYVSGSIISASNTTSNYPIYVICDDANPAATFTVYGANIADGVETPVVGDKIVASGYLQNYNGTLELTSNSGVYVKVHSTTHVDREISVDEFDHAVITGLKGKEASGTEVLFKVTADEGYRIDAVKLNGTALESENGTYKFVVGFTNKITVVVSDASAGVLTSVRELNFGTATKESVGSYTTAWKATVGTDSWTLKGFNNNKNAWTNVKCGRKSDASIATITTDNAIAEAVSYVELDIVALSAANVEKVNGITLEVSESADFAEIKYTYEIDEIATGKHGFNLTNPLKKAYYRINFDMQASANNANGYLELASVVYSAII